MKIKYQKSAGNDCVPRALSSLTKIPKKEILKNVKLHKDGVSYSEWKPYAQKLGLTVKEMKMPIPVTLSSIQEMSRTHKSGIIARASSAAGNHTFYVKNGVVKDDVKKANKDSLMTLHAIVFKD